MLLQALQSHSPDTPALLQEMASRERLDFMRLLPAAPGQRTHRLALSASALCVMATVVVAKRMAAAPPHRS